MNYILRFVHMFEIDAGRQMKLLKIFKNSIEFKYKAHLTK